MRERAPRPTNGGARPGAGRKKGAATVRTREVADRLSTDGLTPLEVLTANMRFFHTEAEEIAARLMASEDLDPSVGAELLKAVATSREHARQNARDAAPYFHPRLSNVDQPVKVALPPIKSASDTVTACASILSLVAAGSITPSQGKSLTDMVEVYRRTFETAENTREIEELKAMLAGGTTKYLPIPTAPRDTIG